MPVCPKCRAEYRTGYTVCADCGVPLVESLPPEPESPPAEGLPPVVVYVATTPLEAEVVRAKLESFGIPAMLQYESAGPALGLIVDGWGETQVLVPHSLAEKARALLEEEADEPDDPASVGRDA